MTTEFLHESHKHNRHSAIAQLSESHEPDASRLMMAVMRNTTVTLRQMTSENKPREFSMTADEASAFVDAWTNFQMNNATYEMEEQLRKEQEELQEAERRGKVWLEVDQMAHSIPGMEIVANRGTEYNYDTGEDEEITAWDVTLARPQYRRFSLYSVDSVLENVKDLVNNYNRYLQGCEDAKENNWYHWPEQTIKNSIEFLAAHRAFVEQQKQREEVTPATDALA